MVAMKSKSTSQKHKPPKRVARKPGTVQNHGSKQKPVPVMHRKPNLATKKLAKKRRFFSEKELGVPVLNMITPAGVQKPKGTKKGKTFVDDQKSMMAILAVVNADKAGQIESKMIKARHMEEVRQARQAMAETKQVTKKLKLEETKEEIRREGQKMATRRPPSSNINFKNSPKPEHLKLKKRVAFE